MSWLRNALERILDGSDEEATAPERAQDRTDTRSGDTRPADFRPVVVGVDFGTSGTKVAFRDFADRDRVPTICDFGTTTEGYSRFSEPSVVCLTGDRLIVGGEAERRSKRARVVVRSPKMKLLSESKRERWPGTKNGPPQSELAAALLVARAIRAAERAVAKTGEANRPNILYNLDVPVSSVGNDEVSRCFRRVLRSGIGLARELPAHPPLALATEVWHAYARNDSSPDGLGDLIPEAQAVIQGVSTVAHLPLGKLYAVLDVGAGTVDMGIFPFFGSKLGERIAFWSADTFPRGCDDLDDWLARRLQAPVPAVPKIRSAKGPVLENGRPERVGRRKLTPKLVTEACHWLADNYRDPYSKVFGAAYKKQKNVDEWRELRTLVVGGGSLLRPLRDRLMESPRKFVRIRKIRIGEPRCRVVGASNRRPQSSELPFIIPAIGLAHIKPEMADFTPPALVEEDPGPRKGPSGIYDWELGDT